MHTTSLIELKAIKTKQPTNWQASPILLLPLSPLPLPGSCLTCCRKVVKEIGPHAGITVLHSIQIERRLGVDGIARHPIGQIILRIAIDLVLLAIGQATRWLWCVWGMHNERQRNELELNPVQHGASARLAEHEARGP